MYYVYILQSKKDRKLYTGFTDNLKHRIKKHQNGKVKSTDNRRLVKLIYCECYLMKKDALAREKYLKTTYGKRDLKRQLKTYFRSVGFAP